MRNDDLAGDLAGATAGGMHAHCISTLAPRALLRITVVAFVLFAWDRLIAAAPTHEAALAALSAAGYTDEPAQIPATVIDAGILKYVPYLSYRIGADRELNVYGDPAEPACIEIGLYRSLLSSNTEKYQCVAFLRSVFKDMDFGSIKLNGGKTLTGSWVIEVTMPDAPDAYGGWWISVYNLDRLRGSAGTRSNVNTVSESVASSTDWTPQQLTYARPSASAPVTVSTPSTYVPVRSSYSSSPSPSPSSGRVYVKSYYRKDGTYVRAHTRRR